MGSLSLPFCRSFLASPADAQHHVLLQASSCPGRGGGSRPRKTPDVKAPGKKGMINTSPPSSPEQGQGCEAPGERGDQGRGAPRPSCLREDGGTPPDPARVLSLNVEKRYRVEELGFETSPLFVSGVGGRHCLGIQVCWLVIWPLT